MAKGKGAKEALLKAGALQRAIFNSANFSSIATDAAGGTACGMGAILGRIAAPVCATTYGGYSIVCCLAHRTCPPRRRQSRQRWTVLKTVMFDL